MNHMNRPEYITRILEKMGSADDTDRYESTATLEAYIVNLETHQKDRPVRITAILKRIQTDCSAGASAYLDAYISDLESKQQAMLFRKSKASEGITKRSPLWALRRRIQLERLRRTRLDRKRHKEQ